MNKKTIKEIFEILKLEFNYSRQVELDYYTPFTLLIATVLSAQTTDKQVNKITPELFKYADTPEKIFALGEEKLLTYIKSINLCNTKAKNIIKLCEKLIQDFNSQIPDNLEDLTSLAGVGRKTANIILNIVYNQIAIAVDTHVFRVSNRIGLTNNAKNALDSERQLITNIPDEYKGEINHCLVLLGRYVCKAQKPACENCKINHYCNFYNSLNSIKI